MEKREDLQTILPYMPLKIQDSSLSWPSPHLVERLEAVTKKPSHSRVDSGQTLSDSISDMRQALSLTSYLSSSALQGYALFFDEKMSKEESSIWFNEVLPAMACLLLRFPSLLELHYLDSENLISGTITGLRVLGPNKAGIVFLSQELIGALLSCSFFCLFPVDNRGSNRLPIINFDKLFGYTFSNKFHVQRQDLRSCVDLLQKPNDKPLQVYYSRKRKDKDTKAREMALKQREKDQSSNDKTLDSKKQCELSMEEDKIG